MNKPLPLFSTVRHLNRKVLVTSLAIGFFAFQSNADIQDNAYSNPTSNQTKEVHVAFAGGGWRAHTGHAAWITAGLAASEHSLEKLFGRTQTFASNSGGSWFNTMLSYSSSFVNAIQADNAASTWGNSDKNATGWLGQQEYLFNQAPCHAMHGDIFALCVAAYYTGSPVQATYWEHIISNVVFKNDPIQSNLSGPRQSWANDKTLILAATLLKNEVVLGEYFLEPQYYQACKVPSKATTSGANGANCQKGSTNQADVTPIAFTSLPKSSNLTPLPFFSASQKPYSGPQLNIAYANASNESAEAVHTRISNPARTDQVPVIIAASASSAATGFAASHKVTDSWLASYMGSDEPISFELEGKLKHINGNKLDAETLATKKIVQIADGGAADNSAVAHLVSFLQLNGKSDNFNIVAFDNVQTLYLPNSDNSKRVGIDIANLFGKGLSKGNKICSGKNGSGHCVTAPNLQIFELEALETTPVTWSSKAPSNAQPSVTNEILYTQYNVKTVDNPNYGIKAGSAGTLHAFTAAWSNAGTSPQNPKTSKIDGDFDAYLDMFNYINTTLKAGSDGAKGIEHLMNALGHE